MINTSQIQTIKKVNSLILINFGFFFRDFKKQGREKI